MVAITVNALYTAWLKRGTTRQLATTIVCCVASALLLLPAMLWFSVRFSALQAGASMAEIALMLVYVSLWGCVVPFSATAVYCLFTQPRDSNTSFRLPLARSKRTTVGNAASIASAGAPANLPHRQPGHPAPFVYSEEQPWGWFVYRNGRFHGLRLALKRNVVSIGREDDNDILLDDETTSRYHAELAWFEGLPYITDCNSMNGLLLNGRRMRGTLALANGDFVEIGAQRFVFELAARLESANEQDDPLLPKLHRPLSGAPLPDISDSLPLPARRQASAHAFPTRPLTDPVTPPPMFATHQPLSLPGVCLIHSGALAGTSFTLDRPQLTVGGMAGCDVRIDDASLTFEYAQFSAVPEGDYIYGLGVFVNDLPLQAPRLLQAGDMIRLGAVRIEYAPLSDVKTTPLPPPIMPQSSLPSLPSLPPYPLSSPTRLRLPSKPK